jgi:hypothetical protein
VEWQGVLAGRYVSVDRAVVHLVALEALSVGRIKRAEGETLCGRVKPEALSGPDVEFVGQPPTPRCPRCLEMGAKLEAL